MFEIRNYRANIGELILYYKLFCDTNKYKQ